MAATDTYALYNTSMATTQHRRHLAERFFGQLQLQRDWFGEPSCHLRELGGRGPVFQLAAQRPADRPARREHHRRRRVLRSNGAITDAALNAVSRNAGAKWFIPTENEWYKAAYHQPAAQGGDADNYWDYPTRTNSEPNSDQPPGDPSIQTQRRQLLSRRLACQRLQRRLTRSRARRVTAQSELPDRCRGLPLSPSFYGTFDQGGNVEEWNEALSFVNGTLPVRGLRGGTWSEQFNGLMSSSFGGLLPVGQNDFTGFRVASNVIPEPSTILFSMHWKSGGVGHPQRPLTPCGSTPATARREWL